VPHSIAFCAIEWGRHSARATGLCLSSSVTETVLAQLSWPRAVSLKCYYTARDLHFITCSCWFSPPKSTRLMEPTSLESLDKTLRGVVRAVVGAIA